MISTRNQHRETWLSNIKSAAVQRKGKPPKFTPFKKGQTAWNKGLTKDDPRVAKYANKRKFQIPPTLGKKRGSSWNNKTRFVNTSIEIKAQESLLSHNIGFITQYWIDGVTTDLALIDERIAIFCDGCYWHGCPTCKPRPYSIRVSRHKTIPISARRFKDALDTRWVESKGWRVIRIWEHDIRQRPDIVAKTILHIRENPTILVRQQDQM